MGLVQDVMTTDLVVVGPELSLRDLVDLLAEQHITGVPVLAGTRVLGVITLDDLAAFFASRPVVPRERPMDLDWESEPVGEWELGEEAPGLYFSETWSDAGADLIERFRAEASPEWDLLGEHTVAEAMSRTVISADPEEDLAVAARRMQQAGVHRLLVMRNSTLHGIITTTDVARAVAEHWV